MTVFTRKDKCFTRKTKRFMRKVMPFTRKTKILLFYNTNYAYKCDNVSCVKRFTLRVKQLVLRAK